MYLRCALCPTSHAKVSSSFIIFITHSWHELENMVLGVKNKSMYMKEKEGK